MMPFRGAQLSFDDGKRNLQVADFGPDRMHVSRQRGMDDEITIENSIGLLNCLAGVRVSQHMIVTMHEQQMASSRVGEQRIPQAENLGAESIRNLRRKVYGIHITITKICYQHPGT